MKLNFDYYHNLEDTELYLCNPDGRELFPLVGSDRILRLRFNDLSELTFNCYSTTTASDGTVVNLDSYDWIETRRLVFVTNVGWFVITNVTEQDDGVVKYKEVTCHSLQAALKDRGFYCEERVYYFYNPSDPYDNNYDPDNEASIPSVMGQLYQQLGIQQALTQGLSDPVSPYSDWTITYVNSELTGKGRNFKETTSFGYDWMVKDVEEAFEVVILFDFYFKTIHVMLPTEVTSKANVIYTFSNFMKNVEVEEDAENIVTVMNCNGDNCDITAVNPTGTNYICDFSYYMDTAGRWMSSALKTKLTQWAAAVQSAKSGYQAKVLQLRTKYDELAALNSTLQEVSKVYTDLAAAVARKSVAIAENSSTSLYGIVWAETVNVGEKSLDPKSSVYSTALTSSKTITAYRDMPTFNENTRTWSCSGSYITGTIDYCYAYEDNNHYQYHYFIDSSNNTSYCKLEGKATINSSTFATEYTCKGFKRYVDLNIANVWTDRYDAKRKSMQTTKSSLETAIAGLQTDLKNISDPINILNYFSSSSTLLKELMCYWIEGEYTNDNIAVLEDTTQAEALDLANELMDSGALELSKVCQPKFQFSLTSVDCTKQYEFRNQMEALELGKIITVEKEEGLWYYPALLEIEYDLDHTDSFNLKFANALRLDDWGYTYGDLISDASSTSRQVSANWQNILQYAKDKSQITPLIQEPLSSTLHAAFANMVNQEFTIDDTGILGRKFTDDSTKDKFADEQMRIINNVILFTDDNWETAKTALGKIYYTDPDSSSPTYGQLISKYGLIGETIIGSLVMSETLKILNNTSESNSSVILDANGITIKHNGNTVFTANTSGTVTISGYSSSSDISSLLDEKNHVYYQTSAPTGDALVAGDLWVDSDDDNKVYRYNGSSWDAVVENQNRVYAQTSAPSGDLRTGDLWIDTDDDNKVYRYNGSSWVEVVANQNKTYCQASAPTTGLRAGDLWIDTDDSNKLYRYNGSSWSAVADTRIADSLYGVQDLQVLYYLKSNSTAPSAPSSWVTSTSTSTGVWTRSVPTPTAGYYYFACTQYRSLNGTLTTSAVRILDTDNTILDWCASTDTTKIDGGKIYTGSIYASSLNTSSIITNFLTVKDSSNNILFKADSSNKTVSIAGFTVTNGKLYSNSHSTLNDTSYSGVYVGTDGISVLGSGGTRSFVLDVANGSFSFKGTMNATSGNFANGCTFGSSYYPFYIGTSSDSSYSPVIYSRSGTFPGMGGLGIIADNYVYVGGDGFSYWGGNTERDYLTAIRPGIVFCSGNQSTNQHRGTVVRNGGIEFYYGGASSLRTMDFNTLQNNLVLQMDVKSTGVEIYGTLFGNTSGTIVSDENKKNTITSIASQYDVLFDSLSPVTYKYNYGTSGRTHTGFIAQGVLSAIQRANLTTSDFAAYVEWYDDSNDTSTKVCGLRYEEFIALNTWQIQKLKQRVAALEAEVALLRA